MGSQAGFLVVFDGAYAARELILTLLTQDAVVVTRLRRDAKLFDLPASEPGRRGRPRFYGKNRISLAKQTDHRDGWQTIQYACRGVMVEGRYKTFLANIHIVGGIICVVLLEHSRANWTTYISTDASMKVDAIL